MPGLSLKLGACLCTHSSCRNHCVCFIRISFYLLQHCGREIRVWICYLCFITSQYNVTTTTSSNALSISALDIFVYTYGFPHPGMTAIQITPRAELQVELNYMRKMHSTRAHTFADGYSSRQSITPARYVPSTGKLYAFPLERPTASTSAELHKLKEEIRILSWQEP